MKRAAENLFPDGRNSCTDNFPVMSIFPAVPAVLQPNSDPNERTVDGAPVLCSVETAGISPPRRGLKIGPSLALCITVVLVVVLGGLSAVQLRREARQERDARQALLAESLAPLAAEVADASGLDEIRERLAAYQQSFVVRGHPDHQVVLFDENGVVIACSDRGREAMPESALSTSIVVQAPALSAGRGSLTVWQDGSGLITELARRRRLVWFDICVTGFILGLGVQLVVHLLVSRPMRQLLITIEKTENGYIQQTPITRGALEFRRLAWRFHKMSGELTEGARILVAAQRRGMMLATGRRGIPGGTTTATVPVEDPGKQSAGEAILRRYLHDRCIFLESCGSGEPSAQSDAIEVWEYDVVEAERLGEMDLKGRLGNAALRILEPEAYETVSHAVDDLRTSRADWCVEVEQALSIALAANGVQCLSILHRVKHVAGVWRKMQEKHLNLGEVHDALAFRTVVPDRDDCYLALDAIHRLFEPEPFRFKDYIVRPKGNGYQSLHTTVRDKEGFPFEVQIRSMEMHEAAENGIASHWKYLSEKTVGDRDSVSRSRRSWVARVLKSRRVLRIVDFFTKAR